MKRFYESVSVVSGPDGFHVLLGGKPVATPGNNQLVLPAKGLADVIADEWRAQRDEIIPSSMPMSRLANTTLDGISTSRDMVIAAILRFGEHELMCYPAQTPAELAARQKEAWMPMLQWAQTRYGAVLQVADDITHIEQTPQALALLRDAIAAYDDFALAALHMMASITGSLILALALAEGRINLAQAFQISRLDEDYQAERWGRDTEADARAAALARELDVAAAFLAVSRA